MHFTLRTFAALSLTELYAVLRLRQEVFIVEQNCPYLDCDDKDQTSWHLWCTNDKHELLAYCRILPPFLSYPNDISIGRVLSSASARKTGAGRKLMAYAMQVIPTLFPQNTAEPLRIRISAQTYLLCFYESFGFVSTGKQYLEDDIPHTEMIFEYEK